MSRNWPLMALMLAGCGDEPEPVAAEATSVSIRIAHQPLQSAQPLVNDLGYTIEVDRWVTVSASVEIRACAESASLLRRALVGVAEAHVTPTETRAGGTAQPRDLLGSAAPVLFGRLSPPAGDYCQIRYASSPADGDIEGSGGGLALLGKSMVVAGRYTLPGGGEPVQFAFETSIGTRVDFPELPAGANSPVLRVRGGQPVELTVTLQPERLFDGVDFALQGPAQVESQLLFNLSKATEISVGADGSGG